MLSGTHALTTALFGVLRPGDTMLSVAGKPYDTLDEVIGIKDSRKGSLKDFGVCYSEVALKDGKLDFKTIREELTAKPRMVYLQRSRGYATRPSITVGEIEAVCCIVREISPNSIIFVDNCYGEFVEKREPIEAGADLMAGSQIKNAGGSFAESGGYIAGRRDLVELCSYRLTAPGLGSEIGASLGQNKNIFRGLYFAPSVVGNALKSAVFAAALFTRLGFDCSPKADEYRTDIVEQIIMNDPDALVLFCQGIQSGSPIDSFVTPEAWDMPGYDAKVVMAAGAFVSGSSIELSADGPLKPPYAAFMQGGVLFDTALVSILLAAQKLVDAGKIRL
jgi:cystathionine beta-lyase family protein involved in aluminum resistance